MANAAMMEMVILPKVIPSAMTRLLNIIRPTGALREAEAPWGGPVKVLAGGTAGWRTAGLPLREGPEHLPGQPDDVWLRPYDRAEGVEAAMREYLTWETGLVEQMARDENVRFPTFPPGK